MWGSGRPVSELVLVAHAFQIGETVLEVRLRVGNGPVVDSRADLLQAVVEHQTRFQVSDVLIQVFGEIAFDGRLELPGNLGGQFDGHDDVFESAPIYLMAPPKYEGNPGFVSRRISTIARRSVSDNADR